MHVFYGDFSIDLYKTSLSIQKCVCLLAALAHSQLRCILYIKFYRIKYILALKIKSYIIIKVFLLFQEMEFGVNC